MDWNSRKDRHPSIKAESERDIENMYKGKRVRVKGYG